MSRQVYISRRKLTDLDARRVRQRHAAGESVKDLAKEYCVVPESIRKVLRWETFAHVGEQDDFPAPAAYAPIDPAVLAASLARTMKLSGLESSSPPTAPAPSLEEALKAQALREEAAGSPGLDKLAAVSAGLHRGDRLVDELAGHGNVAVVSSPIPPALGGTSTDGEAK